MKINARLCFELKGLLNGVDKVEFNGEKFKVDGSSFKAVTMRRKLVQLFEKINKSYEEQVSKLEKMIADTQKDMQKFAEEIDALDEKDKDQMQRISEKSKYGKELDEKLNKEIKEAGMEVIWLKNLKNGNIIASVKTDNEVEVELNEAQKGFIKAIVENKAVENMTTDDDVIALGELFGAE